MKLINAIKSALWAVAAKLDRTLFNYLLWSKVLYAAAPTTVQTLAGATLGVSVTPPATFDAAGWDASGMVFTLIGQVEDYGSHGLTRAVQKFTPVDTATVVKRLGSKDYGTMTLKIGNVPSDAGQAILRAASESTNSYYFELRYPSGESHFISAVVSSFVNVDATVDSIQHCTVVLELDRKPVIVAGV